MNALRYFAMAVCGVLVFFIVLFLSALVTPPMFGFDDGVRVGLGAAAGMCAAMKLAPRRTKRLLLGVTVGMCVLVVGMCAYSIIHTEDGFDVFRIVVGAVWGVVSAVLTHQVMAQQEAERMRWEDQRRS